jgi:hypothetical protein
MGGTPPPPFQSTTTMIRRPITAELAIVDKLRLEFGRWIVAEI